jgi:dihydropteroate synthase
MVVDDDEDKVLVSTEVAVESGVKVLTAEYDDLQEFTMDPGGYFLIRVDPQHHVIEVGLCRELNKVAIKIVGKRPLEIYQTIIKNNLLSRFDHAAYLGRELQKAYIALQKGILYVQDEELVL